MYKSGDLIYYAGTGVCRVAEITEQSFSGAAQGRLYYTLKPLYQDCVIHTPMDSDKVFTRPIISKEEAERLIDTIPGVRAEPYHSRTLNELSEHYQASLDMHDCAELIALTLSISAKKQAFVEQKRKIGAVDERFMKRAEELLFGEIAAALEIPIDEVTAYIASRVEAANNRDEE